MKEIRLHGRGGQGVVTAAELIAQAAFADGKYALAFPAFGSERMGAPVQSFVRISDEAIRASRYEERILFRLETREIIDSEEFTAWMESSAVIFCNSVLGARTNVEGRESTSAAMLTGRIASPVVSRTSTGPRDAISRQPGSTKSAAR